MAGPCKWGDGNTRQASCCFISNPHVQLSRGCLHQHLARTASSAGARHELAAAATADEVPWQSSTHPVLEQRLVCALLLLQPRLDHLKGRDDEQRFAHAGAQARREPRPLRQLALLQRAGKGRGAACRVKPGMRMGQNPGNI